MTPAPAIRPARLRDPRFRPSAWLRDAHLQSILPSLPPRRLRTHWQARALRAAAQPWLLDCGDGVRLQAWYSGSGTSGERCAVLLHGWEGNAESCYVLSLGARLRALGYAVVRLNLRDHGGTQDLNQGLFHSCRLSDVSGALGAIATRLPGAPLYLAGFSLGGNFMLRACAEPRLPRTVAGVVAISPVLDPEHTLRAMETGLALYQHYFVRRWSRSLRYKQQCWPDSYDFEQLLRTRDLRHMTGALVAECTDFADLSGYLDGYAITGARLLTLQVPAGILAAEDDPIIPAADLDRLAPSPQLSVTRTRHGGHCGFLRGVLAPAYSDDFVCEQFASF